MNTRSLAAAGVCFCLIILAPVASLGVEPANPVPAFLEEKKKQNQTVTASLDAVAAVVDAEERAQRLTAERAVIQSGIIADARKRVDVLSSHSSPISETDAGAAAPALNRAWRSFSDAVSERRIGREKAIDRVDEEASLYALAVWRSAETADQLAPAIEALQTVTKERLSISPRAGDAGTSVLALLRSSQRFLAALASDDLRAMASALSMLNRGSAGADRFVLGAEVDQWTSRIAKRVDDELKTLRLAADDLVVKRASASELFSVADKIDLATGKLRGLTADRSMTSWERSNAEPNLYRPWAVLMKAVEQGQWEVAEQLEAKLQWMPEKLSPAALKAMVDKRDEIRERKKNQEKIARAAAAEELRKRVVTLSDAASVLRFADELRAERGSRPADGGETNLLENELRQIADLWTSASFREPISRVADFESTRAWSADLAALRTRAFREALARALQIPEILLPPLATLPPQQAVRQAARKYFANGEWLRLHTLLSASSTMIERPGLAESEDLRAVKSLLTGLNLERAEQFSDAAAAYRSVLNCVGEFVPVDAAADRLKTLRREHPELFKESAAPKRTVPADAQ